MRYLPLFVDVRERDCLLVGGGEIAARKLEMLIAAGARVTLVAPDISARTRELAATANVHIIERAYRSSDLGGVRLVIAATNQRDVNERVFLDAENLNILANSVDQPEISNSIFPALIDRDPILVAVSTGGNAPTLARTVRGWIEALLPPRLGTLARFIGERRDIVKAALPTVPARQRFWDRFLSGPGPEALYAGDESSAESGFARLLSNRDDRDEPLIALIGAGPGDPELLTLRAHRLLQQADVVLYDNLVDRRILSLARRDAEKTYVGKRRRDHGVGQAGIHELLIEHARAGRRVVRLKGGDPYIFGRGGEEVEALAAAGYRCVVVPGITAALGAASAAGIPLTHRELSQSVRFVTGHRAEDRINLDWPELAKSGQTVVIYMGRGGLGEILTQLQHHGLGPGTPAALVANATLPNQCVIQGTVSTLAEQVAAADLQGPTITFVGDVVALRRDHG
jgi:uroporphyrin-III C-methyltransferase/precorrin-2 dehydrogenase/sirohydrochlorin ferrochelatase